MKFKQFCIETGMTVNLLHFHTPEKLIEWHGTESQNHNLLYLCDHEFIGSSINGLDLIKKLKIEYSSILVTSSLVHDVIMRCELSEIKLLPKNIVSVFTLTEII